MMMLALALAAADPPITAKIDIPDSIILQLQTYADCTDRAEERLSQQAGPLHAREMRKVVDGARHECADARRMARFNALTAIMSDASVATASRETVVDEALSNIDLSDEFMLRELERRQGEKAQ